MVQLEQSLLQEAQAHDAQQLVHQLQQERQVALSPRHLRRILKKGLPLEANLTEPSTLTEPDRKTMQTSRLGIVAASSTGEILEVKIPG